MAEGKRANIARWLMIGFGVAYAVWGLKAAHRHRSERLHGSSVTTWALIVVFVLGPCEPLIPLIFLASGGSNGYGNVYMTGSSSGRVTNCYLHDSSKYGLYVGTGATVEVSGNTYLNNLQGDERLP